MDEMDQATRERVAERADATVNAWLEAGAGPVATMTRHGEVVLERVEGRTDPESGVTYLDVTVGGPAGGDPHYRVVNPPLLVEDPHGPVEARGRRWREDPLAALAEAIGRNGGSAVRRMRRMV